METTMQEALCRSEDVVNTEESAVQVPDHVNSCDYDAPVLHDAGCLKPIQSNISFCGVGVCDDGYFELVQTAGYP